MAMDPNDAVNIPKCPTGPRTDSGKSKSSRNAIRTGLYAARDFIREGEEEEYSRTLIQLMDELTPEGVMEQTFATEIMGATWRLRRCRFVEEAFGTVEDLDFDPMVDERTEKQQRSVDRARAQSHLILRRSLTELEKLQRARVLNGQQLAEEATPAPAPVPSSNPFGNLDALMAMADAQLARQYREQGLASFTQRPGLIPTEPASQTQDRGQSFCNLPPAPEASPATAGSFCKPAPVGQVPDLPPSVAPNSFCKPAVSQPKIVAQTPRNAQCPCGSGTKFKRCCGKTAQPLLNRAA